MLLDYRYQRGGDFSLEGDVEEGDSSTTGKAWYMWRTHTQAVPTAEGILPHISR